MKSFKQLYEENIPYEVREHIEILLFMILYFVQIFFIEIVPLPNWMLDISEILSQVLSFCFLMMVILSVAFSIDKQLKYDRGLLIDEVRIELITEKDENTGVILGITIFSILAVLLFVLETNETPL